MLTGCNLASLLQDKPELPLASTREAFRVIIFYYDVYITLS
jgi:hypothetical protein